MTVAYSWGKSLYVAGEEHFVVADKFEKFNNATPGIIFCHGAGVIGYDNVAPLGGWANFALVMAKIVGSGFLAIAPSYDLTGQTWGNDTAMTKVTAAKDYLFNTVKAKTDGVILIGMSMGHLVACNWAKRNPTLVKGIAGVIGASDGASLYSQFPTEMDAAYSPSNWAAVASVRDPLQIVGDLSGFKHRNYYATDDTLVPSSTVLALDAAWGANSSAISMGTGGHTDTPFAWLGQEPNLDALRVWLHSL